MQVTISIMGGASMKIFVAEYDTIEEMILLNNLAAPENFKNVVIFQGKIVNTFLTCKTLGIKEGSKIVILRKKVMEECPRYFFQLSEEDREEIIEENAMMEKCRLADLGFQGWECDTRFNQVISDIYEDDKAAAEEEDEEEEKENFMKHRTVVPKSKEICEKPLPMCFFFDEY